MLGSEVVSYLADAQDSREVAGRYRAVLAKEEINDGSYFGSTLFVKPVL